MPQLQQQQERQQQWQLHLQPRLSASNQKQLTKMSRVFLRGRHTHTQTHPYTATETLSCTHRHTLTNASTHALLYFPHADCNRKWQNCCQLNWSTSLPSSSPSPSLSYTFPLSTLISTIWQQLRLQCLLRFGYN